MSFRLEYRGDAAASVSPYRIVDEQGREIEWANRFLDLQRVRGLQDFSLRFYGNLLLHFVRWWSCQPGVDAMRLDPNQFTESTLIDYWRKNLKAHCAGATRGAAQAIARDDQ